MKFGKKIKALREKMELSRTEFNQLLGLKSLHASRMWEKEERYPNREYARKLIKLAKEVGWEWTFEDLMRPD